MTPRWMAYLLHRMRPAWSMEGMRAKSQPTTRHIAAARPRAVDEGAVPSPELERAMQRLEQVTSMPTLAFMANLATPTRSAVNTIARKVVVLPYTRDSADAEDNACLIRAGVTLAIAGGAVSKFRRDVVYAHLRELHGAQADVAFQTFFPAGNKAYSLVKDGGRPSGQIAVQVKADFAVNFCDWLNQRRDGFIAIVVDGPQAFTYTHAVAVEKTIRGQVVHQGEVQETLFHQLGVPSAVLFNQRDFPNCAIYAFTLTPAALERILSVMDGEAVVDL